MEKNMINNELDIDLKTKTFLIIEDEPINMMLLEKVLAFKTGAKIICAHNGVEGIKMFEAHPEINLIFLDIKMPIMGGLEAISHLRKINSNIPIIALTAYATDEDKEKIIAAGFDQFISKPIDIALFAEIVKKFFIKL